MGFDMNSKTKVEVSHADIQRTVDHGFGDTPLLSVRELPDGYFNTAYHITTGCGPWGDPLIGVLSWPSGRDPRLYGRGW